MRKSNDAIDSAKKQYYYEKIPNVLIWKMPAFSFSPEIADSIIGKARKYESLILDLRGNDGGRVDTTERLIGSFFSNDIKIGTTKWRKETKEEIAKTRGDKIFKGRLIVLIDSESGSASEVFSKVIQLQKRGAILGDTSAGAVMTSKFYEYSTGVGIVAFYGASITVSDLIMEDGKSLENVGVIPDEKIIPTPLDLANKRDPVISRALELLGHKVSPEEAGKFFSDEKEDN